MFNSRHFSFFKKKKNICIRNNQATKKYNVLLIANDLLLNDKSAIIADLTNYLASQKVEVVILSNVVTARLLFNANVKIITSKFIKNSTNTSIFTKFLIQKICKKYNIEVIIVCENNLYKEVALCGKKMDISIIAWVFSTIKLSSKFDYLKTKCITKFDIILSNSDAISNFLLNNFNVNTDKLRQLNMPVDNIVFDKDRIIKGRVKEVLKEIDVDICSKKIIFYQCDFNDLMVCFEILKVIQLIKRNDYVCIISGVLNNSYNNYRKVLKMVKKLNIGNKVRIVDAVSDKSAMLASSYIVICVCKHGGFLSKTLYEATMMGKPSIILASDTFESAAIDYKTGFCVKDGNIYEIRNAIVRMLDCTDGEYRNMCNNAYNYAKKHFIKNIVLEKLNNDIFEIVQKNINRQMRKNTPKDKTNNFFFKKEHC